MSYMNINYDDCSRSDIYMLTGETDPESTKAVIMLVARVLKEPLELPRLLDDICSMELSDEDRHELRMALLKVQIDSDLRMNEDIQRYQQRRYVAQVIELLLFKDLLLIPSESEEL